MLMIPRCRPLCSKVILPKYAAAVQRQVYKTAILETPLMKFLVVILYKVPRRRPISNLTIPICDFAPPLKVCLCNEVLYINLIFAQLKEIKLSQFVQCQAINEDCPNNQKRC